jgi:hypothetical protein
MVWECMSTCYVLFLIVVVPASGHQCRDLHPAPFITRHRHNATAAGEEVHPHVTPPPLGLPCDEEQSGGCPYPRWFSCHWPSHTSSHEAPLEAMPSRAVSARWPIAVRTPPRRSTWASPAECSRAGPGAEACRGLYALAHPIGQGSLDRSCGPGSAQSTGFLFQILTSVINP